MVHRSSLIVAALAATALVPASAFALVAPDVKRLKVTPEAFKPLATGGPVVLAGGALVSFQIQDGVDLRFAVKSEKAGKRAGGKCVAGKAKSKAATCILTADIPGAFTLVGISGTNEFRFSGRMADKALAPGTYRLVGKSAEGTAARSSYARFKILK